ncbi:hypothetical protein [Leptospira alstonii]|uniref:Uncharacterized protein n=1 Tax=Leptospira alstonii serovar Sichuan str. 79601 TaxID=1218565 RepID=M6CYF4_9LEPT|nr:hypothetical protein [Leptospira alstonii]AGS80496.1 hypothetical protein LEP1GSC193_0714 [Leptospira phage vB_LalZ_80412-LE1]EMJ95526.1 hypothetical protein LEP1GSC194_3515 [Leptospira alstonii serovar Sichuan str. 79601]
MNSVLEQNTKEEKLKTIQKENAYIQKSLKDGETFFVKIKDGEILYVDRYDAIRFLDAQRRNRRHKQNDVQ